MTREQANSVHYSFKSCGGSMAHIWEEEEMKVKKDEKCLEGREDKLGLITSSQSVYYRVCVLLSVWC